MALFKKVAAFTDIHFGLKGNSVTHLNDCEEYIDWFIETAKKENCDTGIFLGDWSHNRNAINLVTLDSSIRCLEKLGKAFDKFFWFPGNHDLFYKDKRDIHSSAFAKHIEGITVVEKVTTIDDVTLVPWLVGNEWKTISETKSKYMFGHFELPLFFMNAMVQMPDHGTLQPENFVHQDFVFSGHFHKRQNKDKIWYIGNAFPHNYSDVGDDDRGMMTLEWGGKPNFINWENCPKFRVLKLSELIDKKDEILKSKMYLKVDLDIDVSFEEANFLKETFMNEYDIREISLLQDRTSLSKQEIENTDTVFETVDQIVSEGINSVKSEDLDTKILLEIYQDL